MLSSRSLALQRSVELKWTSGKGPGDFKDHASCCFGASLQQASARLNRPWWSLGPRPKQPMQMNLETKPKPGDGETSRGQSAAGDQAFFSSWTQNSGTRTASSLFPLDYRRLKIPPKSGPSQVTMCKGSISRIPTQRRNQQHSRTVLTGCQACQ